MFNPLRSVEINTYRFVHPRVADPQRGFRIAQISDVHLGRWVKPRHMEQVVEYVNENEPQLVALTGDYVGYNDSDLEPCIKTLGELAPRTFAVLGNHDHWTCPDTATDAFEQAGIPVLANRSVILDDFAAPIEVVGVDDHVTDNADIDSAFETVGGSNFCLALNHVPSIAPDLADEGADLILSGHTHGHQFNIPKFTNWLAKRLGVEYHVGPYYIDGSYLYINRGLGSASWPWRIGAAPELTFFELAPGDHPRLELLRTEELAVEHRP